MARALASARLEHEGRKLLWSVDVVEAVGEPPPCLCTDFIWWKWPLAELELEHGNHSRGEAQISGCIRLTEFIVDFVFPIEARHDGYTCHGGMPGAVMLKVAMTEYV